MDRTYLYTFNSCEIDYIGENVMPNVGTVEIEHIPF